ncbi:hypothetical protein [Methanosarcina sp. UBA5]|uniref:hypothetical protein n=1 Tax=Methanosarcina sp. UBA5 TaxID=1915593 RepID=UPI0025DC0472|nr:hypothetical protein [Methanosarcina sp. UBA5]
MKKSIENANLALPYLVYSAKWKETLTYKELAGKINSHPRALSYMLGYIRDEICRKRELPMLSVIVVNSETRLPGDDFLPEGTANLSKEEYEEKFIELRDEVFKYSKWDELLKELDLTPI